MRALILVAGAALAVSACSSNDAANNTMNVDENVATDMNADLNATTDLNATDANMTMNAADSANAAADTANAAATNGRSGQQRDVIVTPPCREALFKRLPVLAGSLFLELETKADARPDSALVATLGLAACNRGSQVGNTANIQENLSAAAFRSNDITAIDAVTGEDANMAADVNYSDLGGNNASSSSNRASTDRPSAGRPASRPPAGRAGRVALRAAAGIRLSQPRRPPTTRPDLGQPDHLVSLERKPPFRPLHRQADGRLDRLFAPLAIHRLDEEVAEIPMLELGGVDARLRPDELQLIA